MISQPNLPAEIIYHIICFLDPVDVVRSRLVSKQFRDIASDPTIWRILYANARLPRPPGPFPFQSIRFLEHTLIHSGRLAETWTSQPMREISTLTIPIEDSQPSTPQVVCGKWLVSKVDDESSSKIVLHDIDSCTQQVLLDQPGIAAWAVESLTSVEGCTVYIKVSIDRLHDHPNTDTKFLECRMDIETGKVLSCVHLEVPTTSNLETQISTNEGPFVILQWHNVIFDTRVRRFYTYPEFKTGLDIEKHFDMTAMHYEIPTTTHIIVLTLFHSRGRTQNLMLAQAFVPPHTDDHYPTNDGLPPLRLTHECFLPECHIATRLIRNSVIDPQTGATSIRLIQALWDPKGSYHHCLDLTLPKSNANTVLPIELDIHPINELSGLPGTPSIYASHDGYVRGIYWCDTGMRMMKFTIDASQDNRLVVHTGVFLPVGFSHPDTVRLGSLQTFDCLRGRVFWGAEALNRIGGRKLKVVVVDFK